MRFVSIDIETTGQLPDTDQVIEMGAIIEDTLEPKEFDDAIKFHAIVRHDRYSGSAYAINMNNRVFKILAERESIKDNDVRVAFDTKYNIVHVNDLPREFYYWLLKHMPEAVPHSEAVAKIICAGKNFAGFDSLFLKNIPNWDGFIKFAHRTIDPATLYTNFIDDDSVAAMETCLERAGFEPNVTHDAVLDAWDVIKLLRPKY